MFSLCHIGFANDFSYFLMKKQYFFRSCDTTHHTLAKRYLEGDLICV